MTAGKNKSSTSAMPDEVYYTLTAKVIGQTARDYFDADETGRKIIECQIQSEYFRTVILHRIPHDSFLKMLKGEAKVHDAITRLKAIPKKIAELQEDRRRIEVPAATQYSDDPKCSSGGNGSESKDILHADYGAQIASLEKEKRDLEAHIMEVIHNALPNDDEMSIEARRILKMRIVDRMPVAKIARVAGMSESTVKRIIGSVHITKLDKI